jgi:hypothetical protein
VIAGTASPYVRVGLDAVTVIVRFAMVTVPVV